MGKLKQELLEFQDKAIASFLEGNLSISELSDNLLKLGYKISEEEIEALETQREDTIVYMVDYIDNTITHVKVSEIKTYDRYTSRYSFHKTYKEAKEFLANSIDKKKTFKKEYIEKLKEIIIKEEKEIEALNFLRFNFNKNAFMKKENIND